MQKYLIKNFKTFIVCFFPIIFIAGPAIVNIYLILISLYTLSYYSEIKSLKGEIRHFFIFVLIFFSFIFFSSVFIHQYEDAIIKSLSQARFIFFSLFIIFAINNIKKLKILILSFGFVGLFVSIDTIYQFIFDYNFFNFPRHDTRLGGVFNDELIVGGFLFKLMLPIILILLNNHFNLFKKKYLNLILSLFISCSFFLAIIFSGERTVSLILLFFLLINFIIYDKKKFFLLIIFISIIFYLFKDDPNLNKRFSQTMNDLLNFSDSHYIVLQKSGLAVWLENFYFGSGINQFIFVCNDLVFKEIILENNFDVCATHPHNALVEILSETGIIGLLIFFCLIFTLMKYIKNNFPTQNMMLSNYYIGLVVIILSYILPLIPTGSFFSTMNASFFWLSIGMIFSIKNISNQD